LGWQTVLAWLVAACCSLLSLRLMSRLPRLQAPEPSALLSELLSEVGASATDSEFVRSALIADLNQRLSDVSFELELLPARFTALTRICLASGTALALFGYIGASESALTPIERVSRLVACAASGLLGAACILAVGRVAKRRSAAIREGWDRSSRETGKALGTSLEAAGDSRARARG
jgi:hypothetical protein